MKCTGSYHIAGDNIVQISYMYCAAATRTVLLNVVYNRNINTQQYDHVCWQNDIYEPTLSRLIK